MTTSPIPDRVTALYDAIDAFQRQHRTVGGLQHAQIRALLAEHLDRALPAAGPATPAPTGQALALLRDAENYLSALHGSVARHDNLAANYGCAGCELRDRITAALPTLADTPPAVDRAAVLRDAADHLARQADELWAPGRTAHTVMHADAAELRRVADETAATQTPAEAQQTSPDHARQTAYDAVYAYIRQLGDEMPHSRIQRNAIIWRAVNAALAAQPAGETAATERCAHCTHPKRDHDGRADHRERHSPVVAGEPWCHACNSSCDYAAAQPAGGES